MSDDERRARERCRAEGLDPDYINAWGRPNWQEFTDAEVERCKAFLERTRPLVEEGVRAMHNERYRERMKALAQAHEQYTNLLPHDAKARAKASKALKAFAALPTDENAEAYRLARLALLASEAETWRARAALEAAMEEL